MGATPLEVDPSTLQERLFAWFDAHHRAFAWREREDPWATLVLEVMSQQTQLDRVSGPWAAFVERWPDPGDLAAAEVGAVIGFWTEHRLGYNRRARHLHEAAQRIVKAFNGRVPGDPEALETLPGVGPYTANAVASIAFGRGDPVVDTNVRRVIHRLVGADADVDATVAALARDASVGRWNESLMELGGVACTNRPRCDEAACPLRPWCRAYATGDFAAPDVPAQAPYDGSRRERRGRIIRLLHEHGPLAVDALADRIGTRVEGDEPVDAVIEDLERDDLVVRTDDDPPRVRLPR